MDTKTRDFIQESSFFYLRATSAVSRRGFSTSLEGNPTFLLSKPRSTCITRAEYRLVQRRSKSRRVMMGNQRQGTDPYHLRKGERQRGDGTGVPLSPRIQSDKLFLSMLSCMNTPLNTPPSDSSSLVQRKFFPVPSKSHRWEIAVTPCT